MSPARLSFRRRGLRASLVLAGLLVVSLAGAASAAAFAGTADPALAPPLLFSVPGLVDNTGFVSHDPVGASKCSAVLNGAWWRIAGTGNEITVSTLGTGFDTVLSVYTAGPGGPIADNQVTCNDTAPGAGSTSAASFPSTRGTSYLVQAGSRTTFTGTIKLSASSARPANDDRIGAQALHTGTPTAADNTGASQELGEAQTCAQTGARYAATIWFRWTAPGVGDAVFSAAALFDTVVNVFRADNPSVVQCAAASDRPVAVRVAAGDYIVQVGSLGDDVSTLPVGAMSTKADFTLDADLDNDGAPASTDCNDNDATIRPGVVDVPDDGIDQNCDGVDAVALDRDHDGYNRPSDCNDRDPKIHPQARDVPGDGVDQDCIGGDATFPRLGSAFAYTVVDHKRHVGFTNLYVHPAYAGSTVRLRCRGDGCPFTTKRRRVKRDASQLSVLHDLRGARLRSGARLELRVTKPGMVGPVVVLRVRKSRRLGHVVVTRADACLRPGARKPSRCPR